MNINLDNLCSRPQCCCSAWLSQNKYLMSTCLNLLLQNLTKTLSFVAYKISLSTQNHNALHENQGDKPLTQRIDSSLGFITFEVEWHEIEFQS